jgi:hypothetical protein
MKSIVVLSIGESAERGTRAPQIAGDQEHPAWSGLPSKKRLKRADNLKD